MNVHELITVVLINCGLHYSLLAHGDELVCIRGLWSCDIIVFITYLAFPAALMKASSRVMVQVLLLALLAQVTLCQHWSYGWLPGGKRSVGELEATIRVSDYFMWSWSFRKCGNFIESKNPFYE